MPPLGTAFRSDVRLCVVPGCKNACAIGAEELALGMPQLCDGHFYEPDDAA